jgi:protein involved in polysaccharide export with SLBB domain
MLKPSFLLALTLVAHLLTSAPALAQSRNTRNRSPGDTSPAEPVAVARAIPRGDSPNYRLLINDSVNIKVFQEEELLTTERIARDGTITFPFIGTVSLVGRTLQESAEILQARLREYLVHPQVTVRVVEYSKRRFTVLGQVSKPGIYELPDDSSLTLLEAIGMAGGYTRIANPSKVTLKRQGSRGEDTLYRLDAARMARDKDSQRFDVQAGDTILVGESFL